MLAGASQFAQRLGVLSSPASYEQTVAHEYRDLWNA
jgi:hypothetical protein